VSSILGWYVLLSGIELLKCCGGLVFGERFVFLKLMCVVWGNGLVSVIMLVSVMLFYVVVLVVLGFYGVLFGMLWMVTRFVCWFLVYCSVVVLVCFWNVFCSVVSER